MPLANSARWYRPAILAAAVAVVGVVIAWAALAAHGLYVHAGQLRHRPRDIAYTLYLSDGGMSHPAMLTAHVGDNVTVSVSDSGTAEKLVSIADAGTRTEIEDGASSGPIRFTPSAAGSFAIRDEISGRRLGTLMVTR